MLACRSCGFNGSRCKSIFQRDQRRKKPLDCFATEAEVKCFVGAMGRAVFGSYAGNLFFSMCLARILIDAIGDLAPFF